MEAEIQHLLDTRAIEPVPKDQEGTGFYSVLFLVPKSSGGWSGILNVKQLNDFILYRQVKMQSLKDILGSIRSRDFLTSVNLKEAYLHILVHRQHWRYLHFMYASRHFQYQIGPKDIYQTISGGSCNYPIGPSMPTV